MAREFSKQFYASAKWKRIRNYILIRDQYKCQRCGDTGFLEVHHKIHLSPDNIHDPKIALDEKNLVTLCRDCHFKVHEEDKAAGQKKKNAKADCDAEFYFDENGFLIQGSPPKNKNGIP